MKEITKMYWRTLPVVIYFSFAGFQIFSEKIAILNILGVMLLFGSVGSIIVISGEGK